MYLRILVEINYVYTLLLLLLLLLLTQILPFPFHTGLRIVIRNLSISWSDTILLKEGRLFTRSTGKGMIWGW